MRLAVAILVLLAAAPAARAESDVPELVADLAEPTRRVAAMNELRRRKDPAAIPLLVAAVQNAADDITRYYGILILDVYEPALARRAFATLIREEDPYVRLASATALTRLGERGLDPVIVKSLTAEGVSPGTRAWMLSRIYGLAGEGIAAAVRSLVRPGEDVIVLGSALNWIGSYAAETSRSAVAGLLADPRPGIRALAAAFLYRHGEEERAGPLAEALRGEGISSSEFFRIQQFLSQARRLAEEILDAVADLAGRSREPLVIQRSVELLARFRHRKSIPLFRELLDHENQQVAKAAFEALAELSGGLTEETLRPLLAAKEPARRLWAAEALRRMDDLGGLPVALAILNEGEIADRAEAAKVIGGFRLPAAVDVLLPLLDDPEVRLRMPAFNGLSQILPALFPYRRLNLSSTGYQASADAAANAAAVAKIRKWWEENRGKDW